MRHEKNTLLHSHKKFGFIDIWVGQEHPSFPEIRSEIIFPIFLFTFINTEHTPMNFVVVCLYPQLLRNDIPLPNKMCAHETGIAMIWVILNTFLTEINGSFTRENDTILMCHRGAWLKNDVHITCTWENRMYEYTASGNIPIRVGQNAKENDYLTTTSDPKYWWMHASGYPGAHIVVCYEGEELPREVKRDAAVLAIHHSKTPESKMSWVDLVRVGNVSSLKQYGQVTLEGEVDQLNVFVRKEKERLERILKTKCTI